MKLQGHAMKKLTLSLTITLSRQLAKERNKSISAMVGDYFLSLKKEGGSYVPDQPLVRKLYGIFKGTVLPSDKKALRELRARKYLNNQGL